MASSKRRRQPEEGVLPSTKSTKLASCESDKVSTVSIEDELLNLDQILSSSEDDLTYDYMDTFSNGFNKSDSTNNNNAGLDICHIFDSNKYISDDDNSATISSTSCSSGTSSATRINMNNDTSTKQCKRRIEKKIGCTVLPTKYQRRFKRGFRITMQPESPLSSQHVWDRMLDDLRVIGFLEGSETGSYQGSTPSIAPIPSCSHSLRTCYPLVLSKYCYDTKLYRLILKHLPILFAMRLSILRFLAFNVLQAKKVKGIVLTEDAPGYCNAPAVVMELIQFFEEVIVKTGTHKRLDLQGGKTYDELSEKIRRIRLDLTPLGTKLLQVKTWQPTVSTKFIQPLISTCISLCERTAAKIKSFAKKKELSSYLNLTLPSSAYRLFSISSRTLKRLSAISYQQNSPKCLAAFPWEDDSDYSPNRHTISKVRQTVLHMLCANIELCGFFCIEQLWGTEETCDYICNKIDLFVQKAAGVTNDNETPTVERVFAPPGTIVKTCVSTYPLKSILPTRKVVIKKEENFMIDKTYDTNLGLEGTDCSNVKGKKLSLSEKNLSELKGTVCSTVGGKEVHLSEKYLREEFVRYNFLSFVKLHSYCLSVSMIILLFGVLSMPDFRNVFFVCDFSVMVLYMFNKLWLEKKIENCNSHSQSVYLRKMQSTVLYTSSIIASAVVLFLIPTNSFGKEVFIEMFSGACVMGVYTTYNAICTMAPGCLSAIVILCFSLRHYVIDEIFQVNRNYSAFGYNYSYNCVIMLSASMGSIVGDLLATLVLYIKRKAYFQLVLKKLDVKVRKPDPIMYTTKEYCIIDVFTSILNVLIIIFTLIQVIQHSLLPVKFISSTFTVTNMIAFGFTAILGILFIFTRLS